jgi:hypothetical protein
MMAQDPMQIWDLWFPKAAATGMPFARGRLDPTDHLLVHAPPPALTVEVRGDDGARLAYGKDLEETDDTPMARLTKSGFEITREDIWPTEEDIGRPVIMPGGEVAILTSWWNADDHSEWRWQVELYNQR